ARLGKDDGLLVVSDHGFQSFRYGFNVNQWLVNEGYLVMKAAAPDANLHDLFSEGLSGDAVEWSKSRAYAMGLGQVYVNRKGREPQGTVEPADVEPLVREIRERLLAYVDHDRGDVAPIAKAYDL